MVPGGVLPQVIERDPQPIERLAACYRWLNSALHRANNGRRIELGRELNDFANESSSEFSYFLFRMAKVPFLEQPTCAGAQRSQFQSMLLKQVME